MSGRISGTKDDTGTWLVEPVELHRVFPPAEATPKALPQHGHGDVELRLRAALAEERLGELKVALSDLRSERDHWRSQAEAVTRQLPDQREHKPERRAGGRGCAAQGDAMNEKSPYSSRAY
jgi:hypothetical protein